MKYKDINYKKQFKNKYYFRFLIICEFIFFIIILIINNFIKRGLI